MTPAASSGMNTPLHIHSRSGSADNLASLNGMASTAVRPDVLSSRLHNLTRTPHTPGSYFNRRGDGSGGNTPHVTFSSDSYSHPGTSSAPHQTAGYFDQMPHSSTSRSTPLSRHPSNEDVPNGGTSAITSGHQTPEHIDFSDLALNKVPSYGTAVRAPIRSRALNEPEPLPNYDMAISAPPSPTRTHSYPATRGVDMVRNRSSEPTTPYRDPHRRNASSSNLGHLGLNALPTRRSAGDDDDEQRRLHLLRARGRAH
jgi:arrestin-related trafficking adapter 4/5/7